MSSSVSLGLELDGEEVEAAAAGAAAVAAEEDCTKNGSGRGDDIRSEKLYSN